MRAGAKDIGAKAIANAEKNVQASLDYAESLLHAKDLPEVMRLHGDYVQSADALARRAGQRDGPDHGQDGDGSRQAKGMIKSLWPVFGKFWPLMPGMWHCNEISFAMHKIDIICV